jgi:hypothetical protein
MIEAILAAALLLQAETGPSCFVSGEVDASSQQTRVTLTPTNCPIDISQDGRLITMTSPKWVVQVVIPEDIGKQQFLYEWGQTEAKIGEREVQVSYKPMGGA